LQGDNTNELALLESAVNRLKKQYRIGIIDESELRREEARLMKALQELKNKAP
jgi:ribosomal protein S20